MRALLKQTISRLQADYVVLHGGEAIYNIRVPFSVYPLNIEICDSKGASLHCEKHHCWGCTSYAESDVSYSLQLMV